MAYDKSPSSSSFSREQSTGTNDIPHHLNGESYDRSHEASEGDMNGNLASDDVDGDLFGDGDDEEPYTKPYAVQVFVKKQSDDGQWRSKIRRCRAGFWRR